MCASHTRLKASVFPSSSRQQFPSVMGATKIRRWCVLSCVHQIQIDMCMCPEVAFPSQESWEVVSGQSGMPSDLLGRLPDEGRAHTLSLWPRSADSALVNLVFVFEQLRLPPCLCPISEGCASRASIPTAAFHLLRTASGRQKGTSARLWPAMSGRRQPQNLGQHRCHRLLLLGWSSVVCRPQLGWGGTL